MSLQEIISELPNLQPSELSILAQKISELKSPTGKEGWGKSLLALAGGAEDLPPDFSVNHDHYLYGTERVK